MTELTFVQHFRQDTWDPLIYHSVAIANEYELPECFCESDIVIDIGAHIGSFTYAVSNGVQVTFLPWKLIQETIK